MIFKSYKCIFLVPIFSVTTVLRSSVFYMFLWHKAEQTCIIIIIIIRRHLSVALKYCKLLTNKNVDQKQHSHSSHFKDGRQSSVYCTYSLSIKSFKNIFWLNESKTSKALSLNYALACAVVMSSTGKCIFLFCESGSELKPDSKMKCCSLKERISYKVSQLLGALFDVQCFEA